VHGVGVISFEGIVHCQAKVLQLIWANEQVRQTVPKEKYLVEHEQVGFPSVGAVEDCASSGN
jgi:hypothetical protein